MAKVHYFVCNPVTRAVRTDITEPDGNIGKGFVRINYHFQFGGAENVEWFNVRLRDELLNGEIFYSLKEAQIVIEQCRTHYNTKRPHSALGYKPPALDPGCPNRPRDRRRSLERLRRPRHHW